MRKLPVCKPPIEHIPEDTNLLAVLWGDDNGRKWIMNEYIQISISKDLNYENFGVSQILEFCPVIDLNIIDRRILTSDIVKFIKNCIDKDYYIYCPIHPKFIPFYKINIKKHLAHRLFIYGYDKNKFYVGDFVYGKYNFEECLISDFINAFEDIKNGPMNDFDTKIYIFKLNSNNIEFNIEYFKENLKNYINKTSTQLIFKIPHDYYNVDYIYGIEYYDKLVEHCNLIESSGDMIAVRLFTLLSSHKKMMLLKLKFLKEKNIIDLVNYKNLENRVMEIKSESDKLIAFCIKYNITVDSLILKKIREKINLIKSSDIEFVKKLLNIL